MGLSMYLFNSLRYVLGQGMQVVFAPDVRKNPAVVHAEVQSDDFTGGGRGARHKEQRRPPLPNARPNQGAGAFKPQYVAPLRPPRTSLEAQRLYNHIRTLAFYLDAIPFFGRRLPFNVGIDSILGLIPGIGDYFGLLLSIYALILSALFGLPPLLLATMLFNVVLDCVLGLVPLVGDALDVAFKANLRNLRLLEDHLIKTNGKCSAGNFDFQFPPSNIFMPPEAQAPHPSMEQPYEASSSSSYMPGIFNSSGLRRSARQQQQYSAANPEVPADSTAGRFTELFPDGTPRSGWTTTGNSQGSNGPQDFRNGTTGVHESVAALSNAQHAIGPVVPTDTQKIQDGTIREVFTTMRYEKEGLSVEDMTASLSEIVPENMEKLPAAIRKTQSIPLLDEHVARLLTAAEAMKNAYPPFWAAVRVDEGRITQAIQAHLASVDKDNEPSRRVRVAISLREASDLQDAESYDVVVTSAALPPQPSPAQTTALRKSVRIDLKASQSTWSDLDKHTQLALRYKTGDREVYDEARKRVHATLGMINAETQSQTCEPCFDVLMCAEVEMPGNDRRLIMTESSIANILLVVHACQEQGMPAQVLTPATRVDVVAKCSSLPERSKPAPGHEPLLLPGLLRQALLDCGTAQAVHLDIEDVTALVRQGRASLFLCNALRGTIPVDLL